ncbi:DEAD/DEAH box helicase [Anatilimnocola sp. NA78]|uniref:DEAD/DEAH box helicase n=1 Tax=Anatilimnocola sp. NA78 TaxID=3415683 RepID=UPI003CE5688F
MTTKDAAVTKAPAVKSKPANRLTFRDRLSQLNFLDACKLLGPEGKKLIQQGGKWDINPEQQVYLGNDLFRVRFFETTKQGLPVVASITQKADARGRLHWNCTGCEGSCAHLGAAFSLLLEEKTLLGLAVAPPEPGKPLESLPEEELYLRALNDRAERARTEKMKCLAADPNRPWTDYTVTSLLTGKTYRVALRGTELGQSYCSCPDFRTNTLGTCKHILHVLGKAQKTFTRQKLQRPYERKNISLYLKFDRQTTLQLGLPRKLSDEVAALVQPLRDKPIEDVHALLKLIPPLESLGQSVQIYPDAEEWIQARLFHERISRLTTQIRKDPAKHPLRTSLLKIPLLPYQLDGIAFAAGAGRAVLADDMGLGKTMQGVGVAELLAREAGIRKVLIVCPASLKSQWKNEIHRFCDRDAQLVSGSNATRGEQYSSDQFFTICNYEQVLRDLQFVEQLPWDMIILDEGQKIKNWEAKTSRVIKGLRSRFALCLSGTPLENRLEDLYSVVQFIDDRRLGPGFRFFNQHRVVDEKGKVLGYKNLAHLRESLSHVLLRRTRDSVKLELPERTIEYVRIPPTQEQLDIHTAHMRVVASVVRKAFITEMDMLRLRQGLMMCRMVADSTYLVNKEEPAYSTKLAHLDDFLPRLFAEPDRKVVVFSEWTTMLDLIEELLHKHGLQFVRLDGSVPQKQRPALVHEFQTNPDCKLFLTTNAGSTGLNLQAANTVINVDLPWNPAVLEQRIARAHRMGQTQPVQVFVLITENTLEENLLNTLASKRDLALAALDPDATTDAVELHSGMDELKSRLERLIGAKPEAPLDVSQQQAATEQTTNLEAERRDRVSAAGGELLGAAFKFLGELVASQAPAAPPQPQLVTEITAGLSQCVEVDPAGKQRLTITLPDRSALEGLAATLAQLLSVSGSGK